MQAASSLRSVWAYRSFVLGSVRRDYQLRYRGTVLGFAWSLLQPLSMILIYTLVFSHLMRTKLTGIEGAYAYSIHLCAGIFTWNLFTEIIQRSQSVFLDNANLLKKVHFPRVTLPIIVVTTALLNFTVVMLLFGGFLLVSGNIPNSGVWALLPLLVIQILLSVGLGSTVGTLYVFFRDLGPLTTLALQIWFWATPIVYPISILPDWLLPWMQLNPMFHLVGGYQAVLTSSGSPDWKALSVVAALSLVLCGYAAYLFRRHYTDIVDAL